MDLVVPRGPGVPHGLTVPGDLLVERFSRSSGPGGQGVNTADSRVERSQHPPSLGLGEPLERHHVELDLDPAVGRVDALTAWPR